jgi:hypothetical protein
MAEPFMRAADGQCALSIARTRSNAALIDLLTHMAGVLSECGPLSRGRVSGAAARSVEADGRGLPSLLRPVCEWDEGAWSSPLPPR